MWTIVVGFTTGMLTILALYINITDMETQTDFLTVVYYIFRQNKHAAFGLQSLVLVSTTGAMFGVQTWVVPSPFNTPVWAILWSACWTALLSFVYLASETAFSSLISCGILLQYVSYAVPLVLLLCHGRPNFTHGPFWFPKLGCLANFMTLAWTAFALVVYCFPYYLPVSAGDMNYTSVILFLVGLYITAYWVLWGSREFVLPEAEGTS
ncbi:choline transport protein [Colletotrichum camelliae]|nr:choline transport protein [Colletotrichum camelliae]